MQWDPEEIRNAHPAQLRKTIWYGEEVEGFVHAGKQTVFLARCVDRIHHVLQGVEHIFLTEEYLSHDYDFAFLESKIIPVAAGRPITLAFFAGYADRVLDRREAWPDNVGLLLRLPQSEKVTLGLRPTDQVSLGFPYHVLTTDIQRLKLTTRADYAADIEK